MNRVVRSTSVPIAELWSPRGQVAFPVSWHCPVVGLGGALADHDLRVDELAALLPGPGPRDSQRSPGSQTSHQLAF